MYMPIGSGFIQGHRNVVIADSNNSLALNNIEVSTASGDSILTLSEPINLTLTMKNVSSTQTDAIQCQVVFMGNILPNLFSFEIPSIPSNSSINLPTINFTCYGANVGESITGKIQDLDGYTLFTFSIEVEKPVFGIEFLSSGSPSSNLNPDLLITNYSNGTYDDIEIILTPISEGASVSLNESLSFCKQFSTI